MSNKLLIIIISGVIMTGLITRLFAMSTGTETMSELKPREIAFTGSKLVFSMPENFSPDFPAENLISQVDLSNSALYESSKKALLLRRWWDFTEKSFLSNKQMGTIMLSISVVRSTAEYSDRLGLIDVIHKNLDKQYKESNKTTQVDFQVAYPETYESFNERQFNGQRWLSYVVAPMNASEATLSFVSPLTKQHYIEMSFTLMPSSKIDTREFEDKFSRVFIDTLMMSTALKYEEQEMRSRLGVDVDALDIDELILKKSN